MKGIYNDSTYLRNNPTWHEQDARFKTAYIIQLLKKHSISFRTVCEIGCGSGEIIVQLSAQYPDDIVYKGYDISKDAIAIAQKKANQNITFELKDISELVDKEFYDLLLVIDVIEHVEDYFSFLEKISGLARYTVFHIPLDMYVWSLFREKMLIEAKNRIGHIHQFTEDFIINILEDKRFKIIDKVYTPPVFSIFNFKQKIANQIRKILFRINKRFCTKIIGGYSIMLLAENKTD